MSNLFKLSLVMIIVTNIGWYSNVHSSGILPFVPLDPATIIMHIEGTMISTSIQMLSTQVKPSARENGMHVFDFHLCASIVILSIEIEHLRDSFHNAGAP